MAVAKDRESGRSRRGLALLSLLVALLWGSHTAGAVSLRTDYREGRTVHILSDEGLEWLIDPADGGSATRLDGTAAGCVLLQDRWQGRTVPYKVKRATASEGSVLLTLVWQQGGGLTLEKSFSAAAGASAVQVTYSIANGSAAPQGLSLISEGPSSVPDWSAAVMDRDGLHRPPDTATPEYSYAQWYALADADGRGAVVCAGTGLLSALTVGSGEGRLSLKGETSIVPAGRILSSEVCLAPLCGLGRPTAASPLLLGRADVAQAGGTVRFQIGLLPLETSAAGHIILSVQSGKAADESLLEGPQSQLAPGVPVDLTFYWTAPQDGDYRLEVRVPGVTAPLTVGYCVIADGKATLRQPAVVATAKMTLGKVAGWVGSSPPAGTANTAPLMLFADADGPLRRVVIDVGAGEAETVLLAPLPGLSVLDSPEMDAEDLSTRRAERRLPRSRLTVLEVRGDIARDPFGVGGHQHPTDGPPWQIRGPFALRIDVPAVPADTYAGDLTIPDLGERARLPLSVRVWPVTLPKPGPVRLWLAMPESQEGGAWSTCAGDAAYGVSAVAVPSPLVDLSRWSAMTDGQDDAPLSVRLGRLEGGDAPARLQAAYFSGADLQAMLMQGMADVLVAGHAGPDGAGSLPDGPVVLHLWSQLAIQVRGCGFGRPHFICRNPVPPEALTDGWFAAASAMQDAGWSVCGPIGGGVPDEAILRKLAEVTDTVVFEGASAADLARARRQIGGSAEVGVWASMPREDASLAEGKDFMLGLPWQEADVIVLAPPAEPGLGATGTPAQSPLLVWEGIRDGLDEINYLRMLRSTGAASPPPSEASGVPPKGDVLERLTAAEESLRAVGVTLRWQGHDLVARGRPAAVMAIDPAFDEQGAAARMLNQIVLSRAGVALPVVDLATAAAAPNLSLVVTFGSPSTNRMISRLSGEGSAELAWRLNLAGSWVKEYRVEGTSWIGLMSADPSGWGAPIAQFAALLHQDLGRLPGR